MLTLNEYVKVTNQDTLKWASTEEERVEMKESEYTTYFGTEYIHYVQACIIDARNTNSN